MKPSTKRVHDVLGNVYFAFFGTVVAITAFACYLYDKIQPSTRTLTLTIIGPIAFLVFVGIAVYSIRVRQELSAFREFCKVLHKINHDYRDALSACFKHLPTGVGQAEYTAYLRQIERKTIKSACQKIAKSFTAFTHSQCTVTVKYIDTADGNAFCETYERSEENCDRDEAGHLRRFEIRSGANTAFTKALTHTGGTISHFHSPNLADEVDYRNQRDNWRDFYSSAIVVPIRSIDKEKMGDVACSDDIGFLCVDTLSENRLNNSWHVALLAAFADQMYNFMSLMRGKYVLRTTEIR